MRFLNFACGALVSSIFLSSLAFAQGGVQSPVSLKIEGLVDAYYAYDFNSLPNFDRSYTTQPARSDEFNVNLAYLGATLTQENVRGRLALQAGTSVQSNYAAEPANGSVSGPSLSRNIQEAYAGYRLSESLWIDGGIYLSHVGAESFISKDNLTYTRSLVADYSPYYQSGVRLSYQATDKLSAQLHVINGWQNISETNHSKMGGTQVSYQLSPEVSLTYNTLFGKESEFRHFHDFIFKFTREKLELVAQYDMGFQKRVSDNGSNSWWGATAMARYKFIPTQAVSLRLERYADPDQVIIATTQVYGFDTTSASIGYDNDLASNLKWRSEYRLFWATDAVFTHGASLKETDSVLVSSLTLSL